MVSIKASDSSITLLCPTSPSVHCPTGTEVTLVASATDPDQKLLFTWSVTAGVIRGEGQMITWDLSKVPAGTYTASVEVNDGNQLTANASTAVAVLECRGCEAPPVACPAITVSCPSDLEEAKPIAFEATMTGGDPEMKATVTWSITAGKIIGGQGTSKITVSATESERRRLTATASLNGADPSCSTAIASCTINIH